MMGKTNFSNEADVVLACLAELVKLAPDGTSRARLRRSVSALRQDVESVRVEARRQLDPLVQLAETGDLDGLRQELLERRW